MKAIDKEYANANIAGTYGERQSDEKPKDFIINKDNKKTKSKTTKQKDTKPGRLETKKRKTPFQIFASVTESFEL